MKITIGLLMFSTLLAFTGCSAQSAFEKQGLTASGAVPAYSAVVLPEPVLDSGVSLEESIKKRRSIRQYTQSALSLNIVAQLLWATQGITGAGGGRSAPSAGALYPLEVYLAAARVEGLAAGVYKYRPSDHGLALIRGKNINDDLASAALNQPSVKNAAVSLVIAAVYERATSKYGERGIRYSILEAGHAAQNFCLQAVALGLGSVTIGAFDDERVKGVTGMKDDESPLYILSAGQPE